MTEQEIREKIAQEIEAEGKTLYHNEIQHAFKKAAWIARGKPNE